MLERLLLLVLLVLQEARYALAVAHENSMEMRRPLTLSAYSKRIIIIVIYRGQGRFIW